jgi:HEAT repeat protein
VRKRSAEALGRREGDFVPRLLTLLGSTNRNARYGACEALAFLGPRADAAAPRVRTALANRDPWLQILAAEALARMGTETRKAATPELLRLAVAKDPADPRGQVQRAVGEALFAPRPGNREPKSLLADSLDGVDRELLYPAIRATLENEDGATRGLVKSVYGRLTDQDLKALLPAVVKAVREPSLSGEMFADGIRLAGLDLLSRLRIREGMPMCVELMEPSRWGQSHRIPKCVEFLLRYGGNAKALVPQLQQVRGALVQKEPKKGPKSESLTAVEKCLAAIEADANPPPLVNLKDFSAAPPAAPPAARSKPGPQR